MKHFKTTLSGYQIIPTKDHSFTLLNETFDETCHSTDGAYEETIYNYVEGCQVLAQSKKFNPLHILELGFGFGVGAKCVLDCLKNIPFHFYSFEIDPELCIWGLENYLTESKNIKATESIITADLGPSKLTIFIGDARIMLPRYSKEIPLIHAIFQDPFSFRKSPILWASEWFEDLKAVSHPEVILSTYSASTRVRCNLFKAGWKVHRRDGFRDKRDSTTATLFGETDAIVLKKIENIGSHK